MNFLCIETKHTDGGGGGGGNPPISRKDLNAYERRFYGRALHCCDPVIEDVLIDVCLHGTLEYFRVRLQNLYLLPFATNGGCMEVSLICEDCEVQVSNQAKSEEATYNFSNREEQRSFRLHLKKRIIH